MSLGFAAAAWIPPDPPMIMVAADSRITFLEGDASDTGIKTYELGGRTAMVAAGSAIPAIHAAEIVRPIVENHNRHNAKPMGFFDTTRLLAYFLKRATDSQGAGCEIAVAGFLNSEIPCIAHVVASPDRNRIIFESVAEGGKIAVPVGGHGAPSHLLMQGIAAAKAEGKPMVGTGVSLLWYIAQHPGAFNTIGGGLSVGTCSLSETYFSWPIVEIAGKRFLRGVDVTESYRPGWPSPISLDYDETWCAELDKRIEWKEGVVSPEAVHVAGYDIDSLSTLETLFQTFNDPKEFELGNRVY
jgi:hypothetical protein